MIGKRALLVLLGLYVCLIATFVHRHIFYVGDLGLPWGVALALIATYAVARAGELWIRRGGAWFILGWAFGLVIPMIGAGDSYLIAQDTRGWILMFGGVAVLAIAVLRPTGDT